MGSQMSLAVMMSKTQTLNLQGNICFPSKKQKQNSFLKVRNKKDQQAENTVPKNKTLSDLLLPLTEQTLWKTSKP